MSILFENVSKRFGKKTVLSNFCWRIEAGERWLVRGMSGIGKTTLLRLLAGLETPDAGHISGIERIRFSMCFQENRLCGRLNSMTNLAMVSPQPDAADIRNCLTELLPEEAVSRPVETLSGGMARRTALARALYAPSDAVLLDEPFAGLDETNRKKAFSFIERRIGGRILVLVSHEAEHFPNAKILEIQDAQKNDLTGGCKDAER